jgi:VWFA-related protein
MRRTSLTQSLRAGLYAALGAVLVSVLTARIGHTQQSSSTSGQAGSATGAGKTDQPSLKNKTGSDKAGTEVILPVTVRDKKGQLVGTLKQEDFVLTDDGRPQTIKAFHYGLSLPLRLGLLVDTDRGQQGALPGERAAASKFYDQMLGASPDKNADKKDQDKAFLIHFDHEVELLQDFTASKDKLHHELEEMSASSSGSEERNEGSDEDSHANRHRGGTQMYDAIYLASNEMMLHEPGRKAIVVFSDGADRGSKESLGEAIDAAEKAGVSVYTVYFKGEEERSPMQGMGGRHGGMGGGGYPGGGGGYPGGGGRRGGQGPSSSPSAKIDGKKILEQIATRTGGRFFEAKKKDSFDEICAQIAEELRGQYLLTYTPDKPPVADENNEGFRKITLKTKDENLTVITREGYFGGNS